MAGTSTETTQWFRGTSSWVWAGVAAACGFALLVADAVSGWHPEVTAGALLWFVLAYVVMIRPAVGIVGDELVVRHLFSTVRIPLAAVRRVYVGRVLQVSVGERRISSPAVSRPLRHVQRGARGLAPKRDPHRVMVDYIEDRLEGLAKDARERQGIAADSEQQDALTSRIERTWAWPEIVGLTAFGLLFVLLLVF